MLWSDRVAWSGRRSNSMRLLLLGIMGTLAFSIELRTNDKLNNSTLETKISLAAYLLAKAAAADKVGAEPRKAAFRQPCRGPGSIGAREMGRRLWGPLGTWGSIGTWGSTWDLGVHLGVHFGVHLRAWTLGSTWDLGQVAFVF